MDDALHATAEGKPAALGPLLWRLEAQGAQPATTAYEAGEEARTEAAETDSMAAADAEGIR